MDDLEERVREVLCTCGPEAAMRVLNEEGGVLSGRVRLRIAAEIISPEQLVMAAL